MLRKISCLVFFILMSNLCFGEITLYPNNYAPPSDPELKNLVWNKWNTDNFTILSIDQSQGEFLYKNIEPIKTWTITRWGFNDFKFSSECRILCVPNKNIMKKLFGIEKSTSEVRRDENGKIKLSAVWIVFDQQAIDSIPPDLTLVILREIEQTSNNKFGFWFFRGSLVLNSSVNSIKNNLNNGAIGFSNQELFSITEDKWKQLDENKKKQFDFQSACLCLLIRKEYGQNNMMRFVVNSNPKLIMGFKTDNDFELTYIRFCNNLVSDIKGGKTPDNYLTIFKKVK